MISINHTSTPVVRMCLLRDAIRDTQKILYVTDKVEDISLMRIFARELTGALWKEVNSLSGFWEYSESDSGYFFMPLSLLQSLGNQVHLERISGVKITRGITLTEESCIEILISLGYQHGDGHDTLGTYSKNGGIISLRESHRGRIIQLEWFDTEIDSVIIHHEGKREHASSVHISAVNQENHRETGESLNPYLLSCIEGSRVIVSGCDFVEDKETLLSHTSIHMGDFIVPDGISVSGSIPDMTSIIELEALLRDTSIDLSIYTRYTRTLTDFIEHNQLPTVPIIEVTSAKMISSTWIQDGKKSIILADDILGEIFVKKRSKKSIAKHLDLLLTLKPGDYIVHREHGIALFHAVVRKKLAEIEREYLELHYAGGDKLFVPLTEIYRVSRYIGDNSPELTSLSGAEWERTMQKTDAEIEAIAEDILETSAKRSLAKGRAFGSFPEEEKRFQEAFAYEYTLDQKSAIDEIFVDMESESPMDRLISGDVGFGKTEVAMNAIYKAILSGTQVAVLSPLLVLADEHYETFVERLSPFGVRVGVLTRMSTSREITDTLAEMKNGTIDVVVGTHRLISDDVLWKRLGLLIIDEEHKFGVTHKEKIKKIKANLDILSLSATPIPRSLNLALSGLKKISILATPPKKKKPIETLISKWSDSMIAQSIRYEFSRGGQVIIIHNRIRGMESIEREIEMILENSDGNKATRFLPTQEGQEGRHTGLLHASQGQERGEKIHSSSGGRELVEPNIIVTHGQMPAEQIEERIHAFKKHEYNILLTTTIIENGVNFLRANTIIIIDPEDFGLASLHQLRGRVGRKDVDGRCYLMYRKDELSRDEKERLITIANNTHLGAGFEIAMRDMEIRGAGDVLGIKQAGKSKDIGLTLYFRMLEEKIEYLKNAKKSRIWTKIELDIEILIDDTYFQSESDKLSFYREIENIETLEELDEVEADMVSKIEPERHETTHGSPHARGGQQQTRGKNQNIANLFLLLRIRIILTEYGVKKLSKVGMNYVFDFVDETTVNDAKRFLDRFDRKRQYVLLSVKKIRTETRNYKNALDFLETLG